MKTIHPCLFACAALVVLPLPVSAQSSSDAKYCKALVDRFRDIESSNTSNTDIPLAMEQCEKGNPAAAIPVLEKALKDRKSSLPAREN
jgi:Tfp pilus assembly protein PilF